MYSHVKQSSSSFWDALSDFLPVSIRNINEVYPKVGHFLKIIKRNLTVYYVDHSSKVEVRRPASVMSSASRDPKTNNKL